MKAEGQIDKDFKVDDIRKTPLPLLDQFEWAEFDMKNAENVEEVESLNVLRN